MEHFKRIKQALLYVDGHLDAPMSCESLAKMCHLSPFYFHRVFTLVVGMPFAAYVRKRRLQWACVLLAESGASITSICMACGFGSAQAFARTFRGALGMSASEYRRRGMSPHVVPVEEMLIRFTNRISGGVFVKPTIINRGRITLAGVFGDGAQTGAAWQALEALSARQPLPDRRSGDGYEVRIHETDGTCRIHVGYSVTEEALPDGYSSFMLPPSRYAAFDVYVSRGYESENSAMDTWLSTNAEGYRERLLDGRHYCVEYYDERFTGEEAGSIVQIWIPIQRAADSPAT